MSMPDSAVKSLESSTSAFAGSQAAQQSVSCLSCAAAGNAAPDQQAGRKAKPGLGSNVMSSSPS